MDKSVITGLNFYGRQINTNIYGEYKIKYKNFDIDNQF